MSSAAIPGELSIQETDIPGLLVINLVVNEDERGWFKENWQRAKMMALGLPDFGPVQHNISYNTQTGVTRGLHAEPWDKLVSVAYGKVFGAWVDLREGASFGKTVTLTLGPNTAVYVPRGVANGYQTLAADTVYSYLVNEHWHPGARDSYSYLNLADNTVVIPWPIPLHEAIISEADQHHPNLDQVKQVPAKKTVILGAAGQLGRALAAVMPDAKLLDLPEFDLTNPASFSDLDWTTIETIINAAAYTDVDGAQTEQGRRDAWEVNVAAVARLCAIAREHRITLVQISSDYVFDGTEMEHLEEESVSPLNVYGQTKAAGDALVATLDKYYIIRTSWLIGAGNNFVATMAKLAQRGISPKVVADQFGRLTFTVDLADGIKHLLDTAAPYGIYNLTSSGPVQSWADIARNVFRICDRSAQDVVATTSDEYFADKIAAPRPRYSTLSLSKIIAAGFTPPAAAPRLEQYLLELVDTTSANGA